MTNKEITLQNFIILRDGWEKQDFNPEMSHYGALNLLSMSDLKLNECGTNCCLLGKAPEFPGLEIKESDFATEVRFCYTYYSRRLFPSLGSIREKTGWDFLFNDFWPDDREHALKRMDYMLVNDLEYPEYKTWGLMGWYGNDLILDIIKYQNG